PRAAAGRLEGEQCSGVLLIDAAGEQCVEEGAELAHRLRTLLAGSSRSFGEEPRSGDGFSGLMRSRMFGGAMALSRSGGTLNVSNVFSRKAAVSPGARVTTGRMMMMSSLRTFALVCLPKR